MDAMARSSLLITSTTIKMNFMRQILFYTFTNRDKNIPHFDVKANLFS